MQQQHYTFGALAGQNTNAVMAAITDPCWLVGWLVAPGLQVVKETMLRAYVSCHRTGSVWNKPRQPLKGMDK